MREIKFRAWDKFHKKMLHEGDRELEHYALTFDGRIVESADTDLVIADGAMFFLKLMQYTGLKDKNGKEIYEGDILEGGLECKWNDSHACFYLTEGNGRDYPFGGMTPGKTEVGLAIIGSIYENPELLASH